MSASELASRPAVRSLSEGGAVVLASVVALAAWWSPALPWWVVALGLGTALVWRRPLVFVLAAGLLAAWLGARAWQGVQPAAPGPFRQTATLVSDPQFLSGAVEAEVRAGGHHYEAWARGEAGAVLEQRAAGQSVLIAGRVAPRRAHADIEARRHVVGSITVEAIEPSGEGGPVARLANAARGVVLAGGDPLPQARRALYGGFVLGDDRGQTAVMAADFRGSGLSHLLVVSGENVVFVLAAASPVLRRLGPGSRWVATMGVLLLFALMT
jgi:competence protein ComEC